MCFRGGKAPTRRNLGAASLFSFVMVAKVSSINAFRTWADSSGMIEDEKLSSVVGRRRLRPMPERGPEQPCRPARRTTITPGSESESLTRDTDVRVTATVAQASDNVTRRDYRHGHCDQLSASGRGEVGQSDSDSESRSAWHFRGKLGRRREVTDDDGNHRLVSESPSQSRSRVPSESRSLNSTHRRAPAQGLALSPGWLRA